MRSNDLALDVPLTSGSSHQQENSTWHGWVYVLTQRKTLVISHNHLAPLLKDGVEASGGYGYGLRQCFDGLQRWFLSSQGTEKGDIVRWNHLSTRRHE